MNKRIYKELDRFIGSIKDEIKSDDQDNVAIDFWLFKIERRIQMLKRALGDAPPLEVKIKRDKHNLLSMIKHIRMKLNRTGEAGLFHDSRKDIRTMSEAYNALHDKVNELVDEVIRLKAASSDSKNKT